MAGSWTEIAERIVAAFELERGTLVVVRDRAGRNEVTEAVVTAFELRGISTVVDACSDAILATLLAARDPSVLDTWGHHRASILEMADAVVTFSGAPVPTENASRAALNALRAGRAEMEEVESRRAIPYLSVAVPTTRLAKELGQTVESLDDAVRKALAMPLATAREQIDAYLATATADPITVITPGCSLSAQRGSRPWLSDDGHISQADRERGAVASTLPCGTIYTSLIEDSVNGTVRVSEVADGKDLVLTYEVGELIKVDGYGAESVLPWFAEHDGDSSRISHVGVGLNTACPEPLGWAIIDEQRAGAVLLAFGENRYMGGQNASTLNYDVVLPTPTLYAGKQVLVEQGQLTASTLPHDD